MNRNYALLIILFTIILSSCETEERMEDIMEEPPIDINMTPASVGDFRQGGIVIWVNSLDSTSGLVVALSDLSLNAQ